jgi:hypothetical protein
VYGNDPASGRYVPVPGRERVHFNLWLNKTVNGAAPSDGQPVEVLISDFAFTALPATALFAPYQGTYSGLVESQPASNALAGLVTITVNSAGAFSGSLNLASQKLNLRGQFRNDGTFSGSIPRGRSSPLAVTLALDITNGTDQITGTVSNATTANLSANRAAFSKASPAPAGYVGAFTLLLPADPAHPEATAPQGTGWATATIDAGGTVHLSGMLGDGTKISQTATLSKAGTWPFFVAPYKGGGSVSGWLAFHDVDKTSDIDGTLNWFKLPNQSDALYRGGFSEQISLIGSRYESKSGPPVLLAGTGGKGVMTISGGNLNGTAGPDDVLISPTNTVSSSNDKAFTMKLTLATGAFTGTFADPGGGKPKAFSGVVFQKQNICAGLFSGNGQTGSIEIDAAQ